MTDAITEEEVNEILNIDRFIDIKNLFDSKGLILNSIYTDFLMDLTTLEVTYYKKNDHKLYKERFMDSNDLIVRGEP